METFEQNTRVKQTWFHSRELKEAFYPFLKHLVLYTGPHKDL